VCNLQFAQLYLLQNVLFGLHFNNINISSSNAAISSSKMNRQTIQGNQFTPLRSSRSSSKQASEFAISSKQAERVSVGRCEKSTHNRRQQLSLIINICCNFKLHFSGFVRSKQIVNYQSNASSSFVHGDGAKCDYNKLIKNHF